jgi:RimJ/RimL family protein N-acetyltransferase
MTAVPVFERVEARRLVLRRLREADLEALVAYRADPEVARYQGWSGEGHFLENVWFKGAWGDEFLYALLGREWARAASR